MKTTKQPFGRGRIFYNIFLRGLKMLGLSYIFFDTELKSFNYSSIFNFLSSLLLILLFVGMFSNLNYFYYNILQVPRLFRFSLVLVCTMYLYTPFIITVIITILVKIKQNNIVQILNCFLKFRDKFSDFFQPKQRSILKRLTFGMLLEIITHNLCFVIPVFMWPAFKANKLDIHYLLYFLSINYTYIMIVLFEIFHFILLFLASIFFSVVDEALHERSTACKIRDCFKFHQELYDMTKLINSTFSLPLLFITGNYFIKFYSHVFAIYSEIVYKQQTSTGRQGCYILIIIAMKLYFYAFVANRITGQAKKIKRTAFGVALNTKDKAIRKEINAFALQLCHEEVKIVAGGFFTIDYPLLFEMLAACSTYTVITIQFLETKV